MNLNDFAKWPAGNVVAPKKFKGGNVGVLFVVEANGSLTNAQVLNSSDKALSKGILRVLGDSPSWTPGSIGHHNVRTSVMTVLKFESEK